MKKTVRFSLFFFLSWSMLVTQSISAIDLKRDLKKELNQYYDRLIRGTQCYLKGTPCSAEDKATAYKTIRNAVGAIILAIGIIYREPIRKFLFQHGSQAEYKELKQIPALKEKEKELETLKSKFSRLEKQLADATSGKLTKDAQAIIAERASEGLTYAISSSSLRQLNFLLDKGADPNHRITKPEKSEVHILWAAIEKAQELLDNPINPETTKEALDIAQTLLDSGANPNEVINPSWEGRPQIIKDRMSTELKKRLGIN